MLSISKNRTLHDYPRSVITTHSINNNFHGGFRTAADLRFLDGVDLLALVMTTDRTNPMWKDCSVTI